MAKTIRHKTLISCEKPFIEAFHRSSVASTILSLKDQSILEVNECFLNLFEYAREEVLGSTALKLNLYENPRDHDTVLRILKERGTLSNYEYSGRTKSGKILKLLFSADILAIHGKDYVMATGMDITDRKEAEERIKESEAMLARAQELAHIGHWEHSLPSQDVRWSDEAYRIFGFKPQECEVNGRFFFDRIHSEDRSRIETVIQNAIEKNAPLDEEFRIVHPDGSIHWVRGKGEVTRDEDGAPRRLFGTILDITERKQADEQLRESEQQYRTLVEQADDGIILVQDAIMKYVSPRMAELLGGTVSELTGSFIADHMDPADAAKVTEMHRRRLAGENFPSVYEVLIKHRDGHSVQAELNVGIVTYRGQPATQVTVRDITERKRAEAALKESEHRYHSLFENMMEGFAYCKMFFDDGGCPVDFEYIDVNPVFERVTGLANVVGKKATSVIPGIRETYPDALDIYGRVAATGRPERFELNLQSIDKWLSISVYSTRRGYFAAVFADITERKQMENALRSSQEMATGILNASNEPILLIDLDHVVLEANEACARTFHVERSELIGRRTLDFFPAEVAPKRLRAADEAAQTGKPVRFEEEHEGRYYLYQPLPA